METQTRQLNKLLRGELAAIETYRQALEKLSTEPVANELRRIVSEHRDAADTLRQHIVDAGGTPDRDSGAWGVWAKTVEGAAKLFGQSSAIKALKEGEEHGAKDYEEALNDVALPPQCKRLVSDTLLPRQREHITMLTKALNMIH